MTDTSMTMHPVLSARNVSLGFDGTTILAGVDLTLHPQEFVAVVGASGVGNGFSGTKAFSLAQSTG